MTDLTTAEDTFLDYEHLSAALAFSLANRLNSIEEILVRFGLSSTQLAKLMGYPPFQRLVREAHAKWNSDMSTAERVRLKAQMALETVLLPIQQIANNAQAGHQSRIDAAKLLAGVAGMSRSESAGNATPSFNLQINLGDQSASLSIAAPEDPK